MKLSERYRPNRLSDVVGQPPVQILQRLVDAPDERCVLLEGPPGVGKTTAALALAGELGCVNDWSGLTIVVSTELTIDRCRQLFERDLRIRPMEGSGWKVLVIEELEAATSAQVTRYLKVALERLPPRTIVVATSNGAGGIERALLQRFKVYLFSGGPHFAEACWERLAMIWQKVMGSAVLPIGWMTWGWRDEAFSMRVALDEMEDYMAMCGGGPANG